VALEGLYAIWERPRPEEVLDASGIILNGTWAHIESFPSGHMALTTALAAAAWLAFPRLRWPLIGYVALVAFTRVLFGAHFPFDTLAGVALGYTGARATFEVFVRAGWLEAAERRRAESPCAEPAPARI
jgi:membrane-associated phospholipid phosphatase